MLTTKPIGLTILFSLAMHIGLAQEKYANNKWMFHSINQVGLLEGENVSAFQIQTINGAQYKSWFAGIGIGLDDYRFRSIPLFLDLRKSFQRDGNGFFLYASGGIHFLWPVDKQKISPQAKYQNSFYSDIGLGYRLPLYGKSSVLFSAGYSYKRVVEDNAVICDPWFGPCSAQNDRYVYDLNRLSIMIGFCF
jgi:hypothetical protein